MKALKLKECVNILYESLFNHEPNKQIRIQIDDIVNDNGLEKNCPQWLSMLFTALAMDGEFTDMNVPFELLNAKEFDVSNFLAELEFYLDFPIVNNGEYVLISFNSKSRWVLVDKETALGNVHIKVSRDSNEFSRFAD